MSSDHRDHPSAESLVEYAERKIIGQRIDHLEDHVANCSECAAILKLEVQIARRMRDLFRRP